MAQYVVTDTELSSVADAIRTKGGTSAQLAFPAEFVSAIEDIETGGGGYTADEIVSSTGISGTFTITATSVRRYALAYCDGITEIVAPNLTSLSPYCFSWMAGLTRVSLPALTEGGTKVLLGNPNLVTVSLPALTTIRGDQFIEGAGLEHLVLPSFTGNIYTNSLRFNKKLLSVDVGAATNIWSNAFSGCSVLSALIIRGNSLTALGAVNVFANTPFASGGTGGTLYVPADMISSYQAATNWSTILGYADNQIKSIESTHTDPNAPIDLTLYYADGTPIPTT